MDQAASLAVSEARVRGPGGGATIAIGKRSASQPYISVCQSKSSGRRTAPG